MSKLSRNSVLSLLLFSLFGCTVGPDYVRPNRENSTSDKTQPRVILLIFGFLLGGLGRHGSAACCPGWEIRK